MLKLFSQKIDFSTNNTVLRDLKTLEDMVNLFLKNPNIISNKLEFDTFDQAMNKWSTILVDYSIKN